MKPQQFTLNKIVATLLSTAVITNAFADNTFDQDVSQHNAEKIPSIEVITVLGEKAQRSLKDTSSSVSVISEENLKSLQSLTFSDVIADIPNVVTLSGAAPDIRGVSGNGGATGFNSFTGGAKTRVSTLIDGVAEPFVAALTGDSGIWDIEQIEVFRGPQSTNNGRNSIAGAVYIKTKDPSFDWEGATRVGYRNQDNFLDASVLLSGPIIEDELAFRISYQRLDGSTIDNNVIYDTNPNTVDLNNIETNRVKTKLLWKPKAIQNFSALLTYSSNQEQGNAGRTYYTADNPFNYEPIFQDYTDTNAKTTSLVLDYVINDDISVDLLVAYMDYQWNKDGYAATEAAQQYIQMAEHNTTVDAKVNFGLNSSTLTGFVGLAYFERAQQFSSSNAYIYGGDDSSDSTAIYGELSYTFAPQWRIITGGRIERESQLRDFSMPASGINNAILDNSKTINLPKLVLQYQISDETTLSLSGRRGYNAAGGALSFATAQYYYYDAETVNTYEFSLRSHLANGVNVSANIFYNNFDGYQALSSSRVIVNMDDAITYGAELEAFAQITDDLQLNTGLGLLKTEIKNGGADYPYISGNELNSAPAITANVGAKYWFNETLHLGASVKYVDEYFGDFTNTVERIAGNYVNTRFNINYSNENWLITAFVNNAFDTEKVTIRHPVARNYPKGYAAIVEPRVIGASLTYSF